MPKRTIKFGLIGAGGIAHAYAQALENCPHGRIVAVADVRTEATLALGERIGCPSYDSYQKMAEEEEQLDAVLVCTPPITHTEICIFFLKRHVHVLCEKPFSLDVESAQEMIDVARRSGVLVAMASKFRYVEDVVSAKSMVTSGLIGEIELLENTFTARVDMSARWNSDRRVSGGGVLIDNGTHSFDLVRYFVGPLDAIQVMEGKRLQALAVDETVCIYARSVGGVVASIDLSWSVNKELDHYLKIHGTKGTISIGWKESKYRLSSGPASITFGKGYNKIEAFGNLISNFSRAICGEEELLLTTDDARASVEAVEAAYAALQQNYWTTITRQTGEIAKLGRKRSVEAIANFGI